MASVSSYRSASPPPPMPSPLLLPVSLPSPPVRRKHMLPPVSSDFSLDTTPTRVRTVSAGAASHSKSAWSPASGRPCSETRDRSRVRPSPFTLSTPSKRPSPRGRSRSPPPPTPRRRSGSPPPPVPPIPSSVLATYRPSVPSTAPAHKTQFSPIKRSNQLPDSARTSPVPPPSPGGRIAEIIPTERKVDGVTYWDFGLPSPAPSPQPVPARLSIDSEYESDAYSAYADDEDSPCNTPTQLRPTSILGLYNRLPVRERTTSTGSRGRMGATTVARFLGISEPRFANAHSH